VETDHPNRAASSQRSRVASCIVFVLILALGAALRLYMLGANEFWLDEALPIFIAGDSLHEMVENLKNDSHPPLYFALVLGWKSAFGESEASVRMLSVLFGISSLLSLYWLGTRIFGRRAGLAAMLLGAVAPIHLYYSQQARMYTALALFSSLSAGFLWLAVKHDKKRYWWAYVAVSGCMVYTHMFGWLVLPAGSAFALMCKRRRSLFIKCTLYQCAVVLLFLPWVPVVLNQADHVSPWVRPLWLSTPPALAIPRTLEVMGAGGNYPRYLPFSHVSPIRPFSLLVFGLLGALALVRYRDRTVSNDVAELRSAKVFLLLHLFVPLLLQFGASFVRPVYLVGRYDFLVFPFYATLIALGAAKLGRAAIVGCVAIGALASFSLGKYYTIPSLANDREAVRYLNETADAGDVVVAMGLRFCTIEYYMRRENADFVLLAYPVAMRRHPGWMDYSLGWDELTQDAVEVSIDALTQARSTHRVWLLVYPMEPFEEPLYNAFDRHFQLVETNNTFGILCFEPL
jgi:4-amino-4-deoxy-L-arabinose transferase-like glycosyltransferase